jgi:hypothetical protein
MDNISSKNKTERQKDIMTTFMNKFGNNPQSLIFKQYYKKPSPIFHKKKTFFDIYYPTYFNEESPKFSFENDKNLNNYKSYIENKSIAIDRYSQNYIEYMKKVFQNKSINSTRNSNYNNIFNNFNNNYNNNKDINNNTDLKKCTIKNSKSYSHLEIPYSHNKNLIKLDKGHEITNPDLFFQKENPEYLRYREEQRKYLNYNLEKIQKNKLKKKQEINVNPYNIISSKDFLGKTNLINNTILNPTNYIYNQFYKNNLSINNNNINTNNTLLQAGNNFIQN